LREGFTTVERTLIEEDRTGIVHEMRHHFQGAMKDDFTRVVEEATGRKVAGYISQIHIDPDLAIEMFLLDHQSP
jgi:uncharacterized protein YbcI